MTGQWIVRHLGLPYEEGGRSAGGLDCWGLLCRVYADELEIVLPTYAGAADRAEIDVLFADAGDRPWRPVDLADARPFDVAFFSLGPYAAHVGIIVAPGHMLHVERGGESRVEALDGRRWASRLIGVRRHEDVPS